MSLLRIKLNSLIGDIFRNHILGDIIHYTKWEGNGKKVRKYKITDMDIHLEVYSFRVQGHIISPLLLFCYLRKLRSHLFSFGLDVAWYFSQKEVHQTPKSSTCAPSMDESRGGRSFQLIVISVHDVIDDCKCDCWRL